MNQPPLRLGVPARSQVISLGVSTPEKPHKKYCRMFIGDSGMATITEGWTATVKYCGLKEGDVCMLTFIDGSKLPNRMKDHFAAL